MYPEIFAAVEKRENHFDFHQISGSGFMLSVPDNLTSNLYLPEVVCLSILRQVPEKNLFQIKLISAHYIHLRRYLAPTHPISLPSGKIKLYRCLIKPLILEMDTYIVAQHLCKM